MARIYSHPATDRPLTLFRIVAFSMQPLWALISTAKRRDPASLLQRFAKPEEVRIGSDLPAKAEGTANWHSGC